jgi:hypothetical protein
MEEKNDISNTESVKNDKVTDEQLKYLENIRQKSIWYSILHTKTYWYMYKIYIGVHIPMILINTITAMINIDETTYAKTIRYCSATILLMNTFFTSVLNLLKLDKKLEYHKNKASNYHALSISIEEYIMIGDEINTTRDEFKKTYLSHSMENEFIVPPRIIKKVEKTLNKKYKKLNQTGDTPFTYIGELISESIKFIAPEKKEKRKELILTNNDENKISDTHLMYIGELISEIKKEQQTRDEIQLYCSEISHTSETSETSETRISPIEGQLNRASKKKRLSMHRKQPSLDLNIDPIEKKRLSIQRKKISLDLNIYNIEKQIKNPLSREDKSKKMINIDDSPKFDV